LIDNHRDAGEPPSAWVARFAALLPPDGQVLDLACGSGRHTRLLLNLGFRVVAADKDISGVTDLRGTNGLRLLQRDLEGEPWPFKPGEFTGIVVANYLYRPRLPHLARSLEENGVLIYETFAVGNEKYGRPRNPDYLLKQNELLNAFADTLDIVAFEQTVDASPMPAVKQRICAMRPAQD
jgi:SAM-dependent methyltransferase